MDLPEQMRDKITTIIVQYKNINGYHYFYSTDVLGLHIGERDLEAAFIDLPEVIQTLMKANHNITCKAVPLMTFDEFLKSEQGNNQLQEGSRNFELKIAA